MNVQDWGQKALETVTDFGSSVCSKSKSTGREMKAFVSDIFEKISNNFSPFIDRMRSWDNACVLKPRNAIQVVTSSDQMESKTTARSKFLQDGFQKMMKSNQTSMVLDYKTKSDEGKEVSKQFVFLKHDDKFFAFTLDAEHQTKLGEGAFTVAKSLKTYVWDGQNQSPIQVVKKDVQNTNIPFMVIKENTDVDGKPKTMEAPVVKNLVHSINFIGYYWPCLFAQDIAS